MRRIRGTVQFQKIDAIKLQLALSGLINTNLSCTKLSLDNGYESIVSKCKSHDSALSKGLSAVANISQLDSAQSRTALLSKTYLFINKRFVNRHASSVDEILNL